MRHVRVHARKAAEIAGQGDDGDVGCKDAVDEGVADEEEQGADEAAEGDQGACLVPCLHRSLLIVSHLVAEPARPCA